MSDKEDLNVQRSGMMEIWHTYGKTFNSFVPGGQSLPEPCAYLWEDYRNSAKTPGADSIAFNRRSESAVRLSQFLVRVLTAFREREERFDEKRACDLDRTNAKI